MFFDLGREEGLPTQYAPNRTPVTIDVLEVGLITCFVILAIAFFASLPKSRAKTNVNLCIRVVLTLFTGLALLLGNYGQEWEVGRIHTRTPYKAGLAQHIKASVGVKIGLRCVNITLASAGNGGRLEKETIDYNERFTWTWDQGVFGFGPRAGRLQQEFRAAQNRGLPLPILWVVDYFVIDGEGFRFGRFYRTAGWYCHIALWAAFACWLLCLFLLRFVIRYGAYLLGICGLLQLSSNLIWAVVRNPNPLVIPFEDATIITRFGWTYWLVFITGILCLAISVALTVMDQWYDVQLYTFFGVDPLNIYDEIVYMTKEELQGKKSSPVGDIPLVQARHHEEEDDNDEYAAVYVKRRQSKIVAPPIVRSNKPKQNQDVSQIRV